MYNMKPICKAVALFLLKKDMKNNLSFKGKNILFFRTSVTDVHPRTEKIPVKSKQIEKQNLIRC